MARIKKIKKITQRFKIVFPSTALGEPFIYKLSHDMNVIPNIRRGRITDQSAWLEVDIQGEQKYIDRAVKFLRSKGATVTELKV
jgi:ABC-type methionine transport system ATPase subunit